MVCNDMCFWPSTRICDHLKFSTSILWLKSFIVYYGSICKFTTYTRRFMYWLFVSLSLFFLYKSLVSWICMYWQKPGTCSLVVVGGSCLDPQLIFCKCFLCLIWPVFCVSIVSHFSCQAFYRRLYCIGFYHCESFLLLFESTLYLN